MALLTFRKAALPRARGRRCWLRPELQVPDAKADDRNRRSIYVLAKRNLRYPLLEIFDWPDFDMRGMQFLHCMNQWAPIGVDPRDPPRWDHYKEDIARGKAEDSIPPEVYDAGRPFVRFDEDLALERKRYFRFGGQDQRFFEKLPQKELPRVVQFTFLF